MEAGAGEKPCLAKNGREKFERVESSIKILFIDFAPSLKLSKLVSTWEWERGVSYRWRKRSGEWREEYIW